MAEAIGLAASIIGVVELFAKVAKQCSEYYSGVKNAPQDIQRIRNEAEQTRATFEDLKRLLAGPNGGRLSSSQRILKTVEESRLQLQELFSKLEGGLRKRKGMRARLHLWRLTWPLKQEEVAGLIDRLQKFRAVIALDLQVDQTVLLLRVHQEVVLAKLKFAKGASFDSPSHAENSKCYPGTREDILDQIQTWSTKADGQCIFWLNGGAGTGKSTISRTVAQAFADKGMLGASFFFKHGEADRGSMALFFPTIASQLVQTVPQIAPHIRGAVEEDPTIHERSIKDQFDKLVAEPMRLASEASQLPTIVIIADALDECDNVEQVRLVIHLLSQIRLSTSVSVKFFLTSRPELAIRLGFADICGRYEDLILHQVPRMAIEHDITVFLEHEIAMIREDYNKSVSANRQLPLAWPGVESFRQLVSMSIPLFIFAATACRFIQDRRIGGPKEQLAKILEQQTGHGPRSNLDATYFPIVNGLVAGLFDAEKRVVSERFRRIVGSIITLANPLSAPSLARLLGMPLESVEDQLDLLHSVLHIPPNARLPIRMLHLSFRDFLVDPAKANETDRYPLWVDEREAHQVLATRCLELLLEEGTLRRNICGLRLPSTPRSEVEQSTLEAALPSEVQYACLYWVFHWKESMRNIEDGGLVDRFLDNHLLHWLEALGLMGRIADSIVMVNDLLSLVYPERGVIISALLRDLRRIILSNRAIIDNSPLQVYYSVLVFTPEQSIVKTRFRSELPAWLAVSPPVASTWDACLQTLEGHAGVVYSVTLSHDSKVIASVSSDKTIKIWDTVSGICTSTLQGPDAAVSVVAFSHDSKILASTSEREIRLWDVITGTRLSTLKGHGHYITSIAFSHDTRILASASQDCVIKLWDATSGVCTSTLDGHSKFVTSIAFSQDSTTLLSASADSCIKTWDTTSGDCKSTIVVDKDAVHSSAFSHDAKVLASVSDSDDNCIRLWDTANGQCIDTLKGHTQMVSTVSFSRDSKMLASASGENDVRLWDIATRTIIATFKGHAAVVDDIAFSHDSKLLASASSDGTIKIWDREINVEQMPQSTVNDGFFGGIRPVRGTGTLISASPEGSVQLWNAPTVSRTATLPGWSAWPCSLAVSHDSKLLASTSFANGQVQLWNIATGAHIATIDGHHGAIPSASSFTDYDSRPPMVEDEDFGDCHVIKVWQPRDNNYGSYGHRYSVVSAVAFSYDSQLLASASALDSSIKVWDVGSGACVATLTGHTSWISQLAFLPRSDVLVSSSGDRTIKIWNIRTAVCTATLEGQSEPNTKSIAFSHDFNLLASGKDDGSIEIWDIFKTDVKCQMSLRGPSRRPVHVMAFSQSSALLAAIASRPQDEAHMHKPYRVLEFWNVSTGQCLAAVDIHPFAGDCFYFDDVGACLSTSVGGFAVEGTQTGAVPSDKMVQHSPSLSGSDIHIRRRGIGLSEDLEWVMWDEDRMIWLPPAYRPTGAAAMDSTLAIGCAQPHLVYLTISPKLIHYEYPDHFDV
ncbi:WD40 repeat-like protein [Trichoderma longibrachiatum ATCC 18648]|uniref:WD40 repeat-like protein n=1 Tax=Trichoderma longibrachiatum ATCC 18648 TaxID=983965 RepID=A0A2T4BPT8_TRILO|nr:WD40 repeat-like protein [Trichoderma longibrachiatum ATCC 18648]